MRVLIRWSLRAMDSEAAALQGTRKSQTRDPDRSAAPEALAMLRRAVHDRGNALVDLCDKRHSDQPLTLIVGERVAALTTISMPACSHQDIKI
jgi:hypothetical protein